MFDPSSTGQHQQSAASTHDSGTTGCSVTLARTGWYNLYEAHGQTIEYARCIPKELGNGNWEKWFREKRNGERMVNSWRIQPWEYWKKIWFFTLLTGKTGHHKKKCFCSLYLIIFNLIGCPIFFTRLPLHYVMLDRERITGHPVRIAHILLLASTFNKTHSWENWRIKGLG